MVVWALVIFDMVGFFSILFILYIIPSIFPLKVVNYLLKRLELNYHRKIISDSYSCGTRRKLSTALALIGHPQILLLVRTHLFTSLPVSFPDWLPVNKY